MAIALVVLKLSGATLGWVTQFQQPWFLAGMAVVTVLFAASFLEWLPINLPSAIVLTSKDRSGCTIATQALYILNNIGHWHSVHAKPVREMLKAIGR